MVMLQNGYQTANIDNPSVEPEALISAGIGDLRLQPKLVALDRDRTPVGLSLAVPIGVPTGNGGSYLGEGAATVTPSVVLEFSDASIRSRTYIFRTAIMGGYRVRSQDRVRDVVLDDETVARLTAQPQARERRSTRSWRRVVFLAVRIFIVRGLGPPSAQTQFIAYHSPGHPRIFFCI